MIILCSHRLLLLCMYYTRLCVCVLCMAEYVLCVVLHHSYYYINKWYIVLDNNKPLDALHCHSLQYIQCLALRVSCCLSRSARNKWFPFIMNGMAIFMCVVREYMSPGADIAFWLLYIFDSMVCVCVRVDGVRATEVNHVVVRGRLTLCRWWDNVWFRLDASFINERNANVLLERIWCVWKGGGGHRAFQEAFCLHWNVFYNSKYLLP